jgi:DNA-binding transcriptional regulator YhcF (GntR family)
MEGFILLHRKMLENAIFYKANYYQIWTYILLKVNHKDTEIIWNGEKKLLKKGSGIFSQKKIALEFGVGIGTVNRALNYLKAENQIDIISTNKFTEIQVVNWESYQDISQVLETRRKPNGNQTETQWKQTIHDKHDNTIIGECQELISKYGKDTIDDFLGYWLEKNKEGKSKWMLQETWSTRGRLSTWKKNEGKFGGKGKQVVNGPNKVIV